MALGAIAGEDIVPTCFAPKEALEPSFGGQRTE
jgi:hypothetical protein